MRQTLRKHLSWKPSITPSAVLGALLGVILFCPGAFAAAPTVVVDSQITPTNPNLGEPQSIAIASNNTRYVADSVNNQVLAYVNDVASPVSTPGLSLVSPDAVAVDTMGDLFIGDSPTSGVGRVIEAMATNGVLNGSASVVVIGGALKDVTALTVDTNAGSSTLNTLYIGDDVSSALYSVAAGSATLTPMNISGLPSNLSPTALLKDPAGNLFVADFFSTLWQIKAGSSTASILFVSGFQVNGPSGLALDPRGNLYIATLTATAATPSQPIAQNILELPGEDASSAFRIPFTGLTGISGIAIDSLGHLYVANALFPSVVAEVIVGSPIGLSTATVGSAGPSITFNYEVNSPIKVKGFTFYSSGDKSTEIADAGGSCGSGNYTTGSDGGPITTSDPLICQESFTAVPSFPGLRYGAVNLVANGGSILATTPVYSTGIAGASVVYPLTVKAGAKTLVSPDSVAISGLDKRIYVSDGSTAQVLYTNGPNGKNFTQVDTSPIALVLPLGIAVNGAGDLYIVDWDAAHVVVVPANHAVTPYAFNPGNLLQHPISIAFDTNGNLFIGDAGPAGVNTDASNPGFVVEVPAGGGAPSKVNTGAVVVLFPQGLAADPYTGDLYVADPAEVEVVHIVANGGPASVVTPAGLAGPSAIAFDPAEDYYVLDQVANTITEVPPTGSPYTLPFDNSSLTEATAMAASPGAQNFTVIGLGNENGTNGTLLYLNGTQSTTNFGKIAKGSQSGSMPLLVNNIGSNVLQLQTPAITAVGDTTQFNATTNNCVDGITLNPGTPCALAYVFAPTTTGAITATYTVHSNGYVPTSSFILKGTGKAK